VKQNQQHEYTIDLCARCQFGFASPRPTMQDLALFYRGKYCASPDYDPDRQTQQRYPHAALDAAATIAAALSILGHAETMLDVGAGEGLFTREAKARGFQVTPLEPSPVRCEIAKKLTGTPALQMTFEEYEPRPGGFQLVLMSQVLEHARDVNLWVGKANRILAPSGVLAIELPNFGSLLRKVLGRRDPFVTPPEHLNFFTPQSLVALLNKHGFEVTRTRSVSRFPSDLLTKRMPVTGIPKTAIERCTQFAASLYSWCVAPLGLGTTLHVLGVKR
jgi:2-polyprenyl-3-methyl-5-hydroxy-6-metoxy-1,4-benzoquinol methylase